MTKTIEEAKTVLTNILVSENTPILFLGSGFSKGASNAAKGMTGEPLRRYILDNFLKGKMSDNDFEEVSQYDIRKVFDEAYDLYGKDNIYEELKKLYIGTKPNEGYRKLTSYPWKDIYTVNIDDLVENIYAEQGIDICVQNNKVLKLNKSDVALFKLHGCVNNVKEGLIFSESEYLDLVQQRLDAKLNKFTTDIQHKNVIFVGTSMDELDVKYYLKIYEDAGCKYQSNKLIFVDNNPSRQLRSFAQKLKADVIKASAEDFLDFICELNYKPDTIKRFVTELAYNGFYLLENLEKIYKYPYESKLYEGYFCKWQDVYDQWTFDSIAYKDAVDKLNKLMDEKTSDTVCFSIYGSFYTGKSCLLKQMGYYLKLHDYEVLEYKGRYLNIDLVLDYIRQRAGKKYAILIDGASYYYQQIEKVFSKNIGNNKLVILTASRTYYHLKKRYYLEGNCYCDYNLNDSIAKNAKIIRDKLDEKSYLSYMASYDKPHQIREIANQKSIANLIMKLTYGKIGDRHREMFKKYATSFSDLENKLLLELAIFDLADIENYPIELFTPRYGSVIKIDEDITKDTLRIVDFVRRDSNGLSLRNAMIEQYIIDNNKDKLVECIVDLLTYVSRYVTEKRNDMWYIIFQCLLKEEILENKLKLKKKSIETIYLSVKEKYRDISYYWLQLGLFKQNEQDYVAAYNYLEKSASIRPKSYKIQHAIARNYLRHANGCSDYFEAKVLFEKGEKKIKELINSKEYTLEKAKPFSVNSYILEKIRFIYKFKLVPSKMELEYMNNAIDSIKIDDSYKKRCKMLFLSC